MSLAKNWCIHIRFIASVVHIIITVVFLTEISCGFH